MQLFYQPEIVKGVLHLDAEESKHCVKVLRKKVGDKIAIVDGEGGFYEGLITNVNPKQCTFSIQQSWHEEERSFSIHIGIAPTKNIDRLEWFVEKSIELGIDHISFLHCDHSERKKINHDRLAKKAISAMKQSLKATLPILSPIQPFSAFIQEAEAQQKFIAYVDQEIPAHLQEAAVKNRNYIVLIGPEGDFSKREIELANAKGFKAISLGKSRLRTETAGFAACHILNLIND